MQLGLIKMSNIYERGFSFLCLNGLKRKEINLDKMNNGTKSKGKPPQGDKTYRGDFDDLETNTWNISLGMT
jgi:hypothetical protein